MNSGPDGLQGGPPVGQLCLFLAPECSGDDEEESELRQQGHPCKAQPHQDPPVPGAECHTPL